MDAADDITYAIHDLEDFYLSGILDVRAVLDELQDISNADGLLAKLRYRLGVDYPGYYNDDLFDEAVHRIKTQLFVDLLPRLDGDLTTVGRARLASSRLISRYIASVVIEDHVIWPDGPFVALKQDAWHEVQVLKEITRNFVIQRSDIALLQRGQQKILRELVSQLYMWKESRSDFKRLPHRLRQEIQIARAQRNSDATTKPAIGYRTGPDGKRPYARRCDENRCILDYLCTLTDGQCYALYYKISGAQPATSAMDFFS